MVLVMNDEARRGEAAESWAEAERLMVVGRPA